MIPIGTAMSRKQGVPLERALEKILTEEGYVVVRSAGSHGPADLYALSDQGIRMIQLKSHAVFKAVGHTTVWADAIAYLLTLPTPPCSTKELWVKVPYEGYRYTLVDNAPSERGDLLKWVRNIEWQQFKKTTIRSSST